MQPIGENAVNTPAFLGKLWKMVNDPTTDHLISWSPAGNSFIIQNQAQFWYELLPLYYKHNNMSSFVRQLNMYGFHKMSTVENGTMDADKDEIQFTHPYFQKDQPDLLRNIKRKATTSKASIENNHRHDELAKVLTDVKQLRGRQNSVDSQLIAMKQENALLWREVAILRQKHLKQQKIVNKLIQFLVTLVHPSRLSVGLKRGYQLMLHGSPNKKPKTGNNPNSNKVEGPTIHELDNELDLSPNLYEDDPTLAGGSPVDNKNEMIESPAASVSSQQSDLNSPLQPQLLVDDNEEISPETDWDKPEFVSIDAINAPNDFDMDEENLINSLENEKNVEDNVDQKVFLNPSTQDTLLSNLMKTDYPIVNNDESNNGKKNENNLVLTDNLTLSPILATVPDNAVAVFDSNSCESGKGSLPSTSSNYSADLTNHIESTQNELEQFKDILNGYNSYVDANTLLGELNKIPQNYKDVNLFHDDTPLQDFTEENKDAQLVDSSDPMVSGSELAPYGNNFDFTELFDDSIDGDTNNANVPTNEVVSSTVTTPQIIREEPVFPTVENEN